MNIQDITLTRAIRADYQNMLCLGYTHDDAVQKCVAYNPSASDSVLTRAMWLDSSIPDCDPL